VDLDPYFVSGRDLISLDVSRYGDESASQDGGARRAAIIVCVFAFSDVETRLLETDLKVD
jgi:hypothetical protein